MAKDEAIPKWMIGLFIALVVPIGGACYMAGRLSSRTSTLDSTIERHDKIINDLSSVTINLNNQISNHYKTIRDDIEELKQDMTSLQQETSDNIVTMITAMTSLQNDVNDLKTSIQKLSDR